MRSDLSRLTEFDSVMIYNPLSVPFTHTWDKRPFTLPPKQLTSLVSYVGIHIAYHLAQRILLNGGMFIDKKDGERLVPRSVNRAAVTELRDLLLNPQDIEGVTPEDLIAAAGASAGEVSSGYDDKVIGDPVAEISETPTAMSEEAAQAKKDAAVAAKRAEAAEAEAEALKKELADMKKKAEADEKKRREEEEEAKVNEVPEAPADEEEEAPADEEEEAPADDLMGPLPSQGKAKKKSDDPIMQALNV